VCSGNHSSNCLAKQLALLINTVALHNCSVQKLVATVHRLFTQFMPGGEFWFDFGEGGWMKVRLVLSKEGVDSA
jgi:hypothetical protein